MENVNRLNDTINTFVNDVKKIAEVKTFAEVDSLERKALRELQLAEVEVAMAGRDLYAVVQQRRRAIRAGDIKEVKSEDDKSSDARGGEPKPAHKAKRASRKSKRA